MAGRGARPELADIFRRHGAAFLARHRLSGAQARAWRAIVACRTEALGGHREACDRCAGVRQLFHSCRNRHCPKCQTRAKEAWISARTAELLPVPYFHLVFTLPHALNGLVSRQPRRLYELLFAAAAATLLDFGANAKWLGGQLGFTLVLHTWAQDLSRHLHVHALVAGGALGADGQWQPAKARFLFPVAALSRVFRGKFLAALTGARASGALAEPADPAAWAQLLRALRAHPWVVYAKQPLGGPGAVLDYLARYTHRVALSNERLLGLDGGEVTVRVRDPVRAGKRRLLRLPAVEFIRRFLSHVLPPGFKRIRHYGFLANSHKAEHLASARRALDAPLPQPTAVESARAFMARVASIELSRCPYCACGQMRLIAVIVPTRTLAPLHITGPPAPQ